MSEQPGTAANWFYGQQGSQSGPVDLATLRGMAASGQLQPTDLVWREGMPDWLPASTVPEVFSGAPSPIGVGGPIPMGYYTPNPNALPYAGFWWRALAAIIDGFVIGIPLLIVNAIIEYAMGIDPFGRANATPVSPGTVLAAMLITNLVQYGSAGLYYGLMESSARQATLGKMACGLVVIDLAGNRISFGRAVGRYLASLLSGLILGIGYFMGAFTARKQCLHDMIAATLVLKGRPTV